MSAPAWPPECITLSPGITKRGQHNGRRGQGQDWHWGHRVFTVYTALGQVLLLQICIFITMCRLQTEREEKQLFWSNNWGFMLLQALFMICLIAANEAFRISWKLLPRILILNSFGLNCTTYYNVLHLYCIYTFSMVSSTDNDNENQWRAEQWDVQCLPPPLSDRD